MNRINLSQIACRHRGCALLAGSFFSVFLYGCGGSQDSSSAKPPTVSIEVFGARGKILTAQVSSANCASTPTVTWQTSGGIALGKGLSIEDTQPLSEVSATVACSSSSATETLKPIAVYSTLAAFAVLQGQNALAWGSPSYGGNTAQSESLDNIVSLYPSDRGFAALLSDGTVNAWGNDYIAVSNPYLVTPVEASVLSSPLTNISSIIPGRLAYFGVRKDGSLNMWGGYMDLEIGSFIPVNHPAYGIDNSILSSLKNIQSITSTIGAYAALKNDGTVVTFGDASSGGDSHAVQSQLTNVTKIVGTDYDFLALRKDGSVITWGFDFAKPENGQIISNVKDLSANGVVGVAITSSGNAFAFGDSLNIDAANSNSVANLLVNVSHIYSTQSSFAALLSNGNVVSWGDSPRMKTSLNQIQPSLINVKTIASSEYAFAALKNDGTVVTWGESSFGGDSSSVQAQLTNVVSITSNKHAFAAIKSDGSVVTWGDAKKGGDSSRVSSKLKNIRAIYSTPFGAFLAISKDGSFTNWGDEWAGGGVVPRKLVKIPFAS